MMIKAPYKLLLLLMILSFSNRAISQASMSEVSRARMPSFSYSYADKSCKDALEKRFNEFKAQDERDAKRLTNQLQSHKNGWVEVSPGICNAGGPPPVCPVTNHWVKDGSSMQKWNAEQNEVRAQRESELRRILDNCNTSARARQEETRKENEQKARDEANAKAAQLKEDQNKKMAAQDKARAEAAAKRQAEIDRINAENAMRMAELKAKQERLDNAMRNLQSDMTANNRETEDKLARARAQNTLDADNSGTINEANNILNSAKVSASEVFGNALNPSGNGYNEEEKTSMSNMGAAYNDYERSGGEDYNYGKSIASKIFGFFSPKQDTRIEDIPENGYSSADESVSRTSKITNLFSSVKEKLSWLKPTLPSGMLIDQYKASLDQVRNAENGGDPIDAEYIGKVGGSSIGNFIGMGIVGAGIWGASTIITTTVVTTAPAIAVGAAVYLLYKEGKKLKNFIAEKQEL
jgi:hypothetical protein